MTIYKLKNVFVPGGQPELTYVSREHLHLEKRIGDYLEDLHRVLSISGPTKSGKTVLVRKVVPKGVSIWVSGGQVDSLEDFWNIVNEEIGSYSSITESDSSLQTHTEARTIDASLRPGGMGGGVSSNVGDTNTDNKSLARTKVSDPKRNAIKGLLERDLPLIIDDFHYIDKDIQTKIIRSLKEPVFDGLGVILLSVPHRSFDAVRVEREMTGRVLQVLIALWNTDELKQIAKNGFSALKVEFEEMYIDKLALESFGSPHLMQDFCLGVCKLNDISCTLPSKRLLTPPASWDEFFRSRASDASKTAFDRLAMGPRQRTERIQRPRHGGGTLDIYKAILLAIANTGPKFSLSYEDIRASLRDILIDLPEAHEVSRVLDKMTEIAKKYLEGEPVVDWDKPYSTLHLSDPFFAFYLKWAIKTT